MHRTSDILGVILVCVQIPLAVLCALQLLDVSARTDAIVLPSLFGAFFLAALILLVVAILQHRRVLWFHSRLRWGVILFTSAVWLLMSYLLKAPGVFFVLLGFLPALIRGVVAKQPYKAKRSL